MVFKKKKTGKAGRPHAKPPFSSRAVCRGNPMYGSPTFLAASTLRIADSDSGLELKEACHDSVSGKQTVPRAKPMAVVVLA